MVGISDGIIEAAQIDGANSLQEFFYVIMPSIFNTFALFIITGMITIFNGQAGLFNFYGMEAPIRMYTFGYYLFEATSSAGTQYQLFPPIAALGLALTSFAIPIIFTCRHLLSKYGPKDE
jgi:ABC-type glycerol-3-phosphate transport system permease component